MQAKIIKLYHKVSLLKSRLENWNKKNNHKQLKALKDQIIYIYEIYNIFFPWEARHLSNWNYRKNILWKESIKSNKTYSTNLIKYSTRISNEELKDDIKSNNLNNNLEQHLMESFFERWVNNLRFGLNIMTKWEQALLKEENGEEVFKKNTLQDKEKLLRDEINIEKYKKELDEVRKTWDKEKIAEKESEASNSIIKALYDNFPYQITKESYWDKPSKIKQSKELFCVWSSIVWHAFLSELWIKHKWMNIPMHSALEINIWWKTYLFDWVRYDNIIEFNYLKKQSIYKKQVYRDFALVWNNDDSDKWNSWEVEKVLLSQIYNNKISSLNKLWKYEEIIKLDPTNIEAYDNIAYNLYIKQEYEEAIEIYNKIIKLEPKKVYAYKDKWKSLMELWKYKEVIKVYNKLVELEPEEAGNYLEKSICYSLLNNVDRALNNLKIFYEKWTYYKPEQIITLLSNPNFDNIRETEEFIEFVEKVKKSIER
jgi:tetratricopeptide (TPR) repeat protein